MEDDEDVILEGASLHQHLQEVGFTDFEVISSQNRSHEFVKNFNKFERRNQNTEKNEGSFIRDAAFMFLGVTNVEDVFLNSLTSRIMLTKLLEEEDLLILETLSPSIERLASDPDIIHKSKTDGRFRDIPTLNFYKLSSLTTMVWCSVAVLILSLKLVWDFNVTHCLCITFMAFLFISYFRYSYLNKFKSSLSKVDEILYIMEKTNQISKKCLKFLNEINIIKKGLNQKTGVLDMYECCHETSLCEGVYHLLDSLTSILKLGHVQLVNSEHCHLGHIQSIFSKKFDFKTTQNEDENNYLILKTKRNITAVQSSTFLTELFLCFEFSMNTSVFKFIPKEKCSYIKNKIKLLERTLNLFQKFWLKEEPNFTEIKVPKSYEKLKSDVKGAVDVLSVHCRILAYSGIYLKERLAESYEKENSDFLYELVQKGCDDIKNEILSCNACLEEVLERTENLFGRKCDDSSWSVFNGEIKKSETQEQILQLSNVVPTQIYGLKDPVIEDEVFEAIVDYNKANDTKIDEDGTWLQSLKAEKHMKKKQRVRCRRVLQEIQPILQKRREMWQERESEALRRMRMNGKGEELSPSETSPISGDSGVSSPVLGCNPILGNSLIEESVPLILSEDEAFPKASGNENVHKGKDANHVDKFCNAESCSNLDLDNEDDSEEERLLLYKKVKKELDEDEARRKGESDDDNDSESEKEELRDDFLAKRKKFKLPVLSFREFARVTRNSLGDDTVSLTSDSNHDCQIGLETNCEDFGSVDPRSESRDSFKSRNLCQDEDENKSSIAAKKSLLNENTSFLDITEAILPDFQRSISSPTFDLAKSAEANRTIPERDKDAPCLPLFSKVTSSSQQLDGGPQIQCLKAKSECFSCGDSDEEDERVLDWSSCGFARRREDSEDITREISFSGLPSVLASGVLKRGQTVGKGEEVFGGVGEGESETESESTEEDE